MPRYEPTKQLIYAEPEIYDTRYIFDGPAAMFAWYGFSSVASVAEVCKTIGLPKIAVAVEARQTMLVHCFVDMIEALTTIHKATKELCAALAESVCIKATATALPAFQACMCVSADFIAAVTEVNTSGT